MTEKKRPNVTGKGPALTREMLELFKEMTEGGLKLSDEASQKMKAVLEERTQEFNKVIKMAFLKTVKAGEVAYDCKEMTLEMQAAVGSGDEARAMEILEILTNDLDELLHKIKTFVVRMT
ncbi:MAG: hypothetical protein A2097_07335 [Desulfobacula sp. GWF2_41_7]|nr:MAG: hypothetical protein A2097_07335 [Desulfobacula sp. GWF2_41_7]